MKPNELYIGLMSGTSVDAVDAVVLDFANPDKPALVEVWEQPPPADVRSKLLALTEANVQISLANLGDLDQQVGCWFADAANAVMDRAGLTAQDIAAIGSHGQTLFHQPNTPLGFSIQIGCPSRIAAKTGCAVVADFRSADIAAGGQGAPLAPAFHAEVFGDSERTCAVLNLGGIANLSVIRPRRPGDDSRVLGFDTGPGNALMDAWIAAHSEQTYDDNGSWAASADVDDNLLTQLLSDRFIQDPPPKSTGRDHYGLPWLRAQLEVCHEQPTPATVQATLCRFTAESAADAINAHAPSDCDVILCGGGARNPVLQRAIADRVSPRRVSVSDNYGIASDWLEGMAFAWLARQYCHGKPGNLPSVTGARVATCLGGLFPPPKQPG